MHGTTYRYQVRLAVNGLLDTDNAVWAGPVSDTPLVLGSAYQPLPRERLSRMPAPDLEF